MTAFATKREAERANLQTQTALLSNFSLHDLREAFYGSLISPTDNIRAYLQSQTGLTTIQSLGDLWRQFFIGKGVTNRISLTDMAVDYFTNSDLGNPITPILDNFNRANSTTTLGSNWTLLSNFGAGGTNCGISSNQAYNPNSGQFKAMYWNPATFGPDCEVFITIATRSATNDTDCPAIYLRLTNLGANFNGYFLGLKYSDNSIHISKNVNGVETVLGTVTQAITSGDKLWFKAVGSILTGYWWNHNTSTWTQIIQVTDTTYTGGGSLAFYVPGNHVDDRFDDFGGGTIVSS